MRLSLVITMILYFSSPAYLACQNLDSKYIRKIYYQAEHLYNLEESTEKTDSLAFSKYNILIEKTNPDIQENHYIIYDAYVKSGILENVYWSVTSSIDRYKKAISISKEFFLSDSTLFHPNLYIGMAFYSLQEIDSSIAYLKVADEIANKYKDLSEKSQLYNTLGVIYHKLGNYFLSINYINKAILTASENEENNELFLITCKSNIASALRKLGKYEEAISTYRSMLNSQINSNDLYTNLGVTYFKKNNMDSALYFLDKVTIPSGKLCYNLAGIYIRKRKFKKAHALLDSALKSSSIGSERSGSKVLIYKRIADLFQEEYQYEKAFKYYQKSLIEAVYRFNDSSVYSNPNNKQLTISNYDLFNTEVAKANLFNKIYRNSKSTNDLTGTFNAYESAIKTSDFIAKYFDNDEARIFHTTEALSFYKEAVDFLIFAYKQTNDDFYLETAFAWSEKSKASTLWLHSKEGRLKLKKQLPDSLLRLEHRLKLSLSRLSKKVAHTKEKTESETISNEIIRIQLKLSNIRESFLDYPDYHKQVFAYDSINIASIQKDILHKRQGLLSYFFCKNRLLIFFLNKENLTFKEVEFSDKEKHLLNELLIQLRTIRPGSIYDGQVNSMKLYQILVKPFERSLKQINSLIIIPHQELISLSFESLQPTETKYLLEDLDTSYEFSASFLTKPKNLHDYLNESISVAPFTTLNPTQFNDITVLPESINEIQDLKGRHLIDDQATRENFIRLIKNFKILHLATHAFVNDDLPENSSIWFYPVSEKESENKLYLNELSAMDLNQLELAFLSACETNTGKLINGEGIMGISRSFANAGCNNIITSLWKAEDHVSSFISKSFYKYLEDGYSPSKSLQLSKLLLLKNKEFSQFSSPNYWSNLIYIGNNQEKKVSVASAFLITLMLILVSAIVFTTLIRIKRKKNLIS